MQNSVSADEFEQTIDITAVEVGFVLACENAGQFELLERGQLRECAGIGLGEVARQSGFGQQARNRQHGPGEAGQLRLESFGMFGGHLQRIDRPKCSLPERVCV